MLDLPQPLGVDTSISQTGSPGDLGSAQVAPGLDSSAAPWLDPAVLLPTVSPDEFAASLGGMPMAFTGGSKAVAAGDTSLRGDVVKYAKQFLGMQYRWGGSNPQSSFDCSGFVQYVLKHFGVNAPRVSFQQARFGRQVSVGQARAGDLIAWDNSSRNNGADHIALYLGNGQIMEFYRTGKPSRIRTLGKKEKYWAVAIDYPGER